MLQDYCETVEIGAALLGVSHGEVLDSNTLAIRTIEAFESLNEPVEVVDLLLATISQMARDDHSFHLHQMSESLRAIWDRKISLV